MYGVVVLFGQTAFQENYNGMDFVIRNPDLETEPKTGDIDNIDTASVVFKKDGDSWEFYSFNASGDTLLKLDTLGGIWLYDTIGDGNGTIYKNNKPWLHNFHHPTGDTEIPYGHNLFLGDSVGNYTLGSLATIFNAAL